MRKFFKLANECGFRQLTCSETSLFYMDAAERQCIEAAAAARQRAVTPYSAFPWAQLLTGYAPDAAVRIADSRALKVLSWFAVKELLSRAFTLKAKNVFEKQGTSRKLPR